MRQEYAVYSHLATKEGVEGVVRVHGSFKDAENGVLDGAGMSLRQREFMGRQSPENYSRRTVCLLAPFLHGSFKYIL